MTLAIVNVFPSISVVLSMIVHILSPITDIFHPIMRILMRVAEILVSLVVHPFLHLCLNVLRQPLHGLMDVFVALLDRFIGVLVPAFPSFPTPGVALFHELLVALRVRRLQFLQTTFQMCSALLHVLLESLRPMLL